MINEPIRLPGSSLPAGTSHGTYLKFHWSTGILGDRGASVNDARGRVPGIFSAGIDGRAGMICRLEAELVNGLRCYTDIKQLWLRFTCAVQIGKGC